MSGSGDERRQAHKLLIDTMRNNFSARGRLVAALDELIARGRQAPLSPAALDLAEQIFREMDVVDLLIGDGRRLMRELGG